MPKGYKPAGSGRKAKEEGNARRITFSVTFSHAEAAAIEELRGEMPRSQWIRGIVNQRLYEARKATLQDEIKRRMNA